eukprot:GFUD01008003.1.p1 GENE.GFUD01008003.1~~GFUD01008003.1.p1  ORF type:complete len:210 (-),score=51.29 GFUD01008003.1:514-1143(-)
MGCLSSKEKDSEQKNKIEQSQRTQQRRNSDGQRRNSDGQRRLSDGGGQRRFSDSGGAEPHGGHRAQGHNQGRRSSQSSAGSNNTMERQNVKRVDMTSSKGIEHRDKERVVTDPRGGRRVRDRDTLNPRDSSRENGVREDGLSKRNQFDRASQLRRSKKRKKSKENEVLTTKSPPKTAKDIVNQETEASQMEANSSHSRTEYHSKYGNLI